jgi:nucleotide-binding universal stress UspA family protein
VLFADILVAISGEERSWSALAQALILAQREGAHLHGLHVVSTQEDEESAEIQVIRSEFDRRCHEARLEGSLVVEVGAIQRAICDRARWADLVILSLSHPPAPGAIARLSSGLTTIIRRCPRPVMTVPAEPSSLSHPLLAYDGTPKAKEALFVAAYISGRWAVPLTVLTVVEGEQVTPEIQEEARDYLDAHGVDANLIAAEPEEEGTVADSILRVAEEQGCDLILMGGYGVGPVVEVLLGSQVDRVLRKSRWPALICR